MLWGVSVGIVMWLQWVGVLVGVGAAVGCGDVVVWVLRWVL